MTYRAVARPGGDFGGFNVWQNSLPYLNQGGRLYPPQYYKPSPPNFQTLRRPWHVSGINIRYFYSFKNKMKLLTEKEFILQLCFLNPCFNSSTAQWRFVCIDIVTLNLSKNSKFQENCLILLSPNEKSKKKWYNVRLDCFKARFILIKE